MPAIEIKRLETMPFVKMMTVITTVTGAIGGAIQGVNNILSGVGQPSDIPILFGLGLVSGLIGGLISWTIIALTYNFTASKMGGLVFKAEAPETKEAKKK